MLEAHDEKDASNSVVIRGASAHNLKNLSVVIPKYSVVAITGPSGAGKSSLVFDTLYAEFVRMFYLSEENSLSVGSVESIENLSYCSALKQEFSASRLKTVGSESGLLTILTEIFFALGERRSLCCGSALVSHSEREILKSVFEWEEGVLLEILFPAESVEDVRRYAQEGFSRVYVGDEMFPINEVLDEVLDREEVSEQVFVFADALALYRNKESRVAESIRIALERTGAVSFNVKRGKEILDKKFFSSVPRCVQCGKKEQVLTRKDFSYQATQKRFRSIVSRVFLGAQSLDAIYAKSISYVRDWAEVLLRESSHSADRRSTLRELCDKLSLLCELGVGYLELERSLRSISSGEFQRIRLSKVLGEGITGVIYLLDEPSNGLHPKNIEVLGRVFKKFTAQGDTIIFVDHLPELIEVANHEIALGPGAGERGGQIVYEGRARKKKTTFKKKGNEEEPQEWLTFTVSQYRNIKNATVRIPKKRLVSLCGVSGSGKSSLLDIVYATVKKGLEENQGGEVARVSYLRPNYSKFSSRSTVASLLGLTRPIAEVFASSVSAKIGGLGREHFSLSHKAGRCETCEGAGERFLTMKIPCRECLGTGFTEIVSNITFKDKTITDVLGFSVAQALEFFSWHPEIKEKLLPLLPFGLSYLRIGEKIRNISLGERQRLLLSKEFSHQGSNILYLLDEPTSGLSEEEIEPLLNMLYQLIERGNSVVAIEHSALFLGASDYLIELGPDAGHKGGEIIAQGSVSELKKNASSIIGAYLES